MKYIAQPGTSLGRMWSLTKDQSPLTGSQWIGNVFLLCFFLFFLCDCSPRPFYDLLGDLRLSVHISDPRAYKHRVQSCISIMKKGLTGREASQCRRQKKRKKTLLVCSLLDELQKSVSVQPPGNFKHTT